MGAKRAPGLVVPCCNVPPKHDGEHTMWAVRPRARRRCFPPPSVSLVASLAWLRRSAGCPRRTLVGAWARFAHEYGKNSASMFYSGRERSLPRLARSGSSLKLLPGNLDRKQPETHALPDALALYT
jgi:hypothetical protein